MEHLLLSVGSAIRHWERCVSLSLRLQFLEERLREHRIIEGVEKSEAVTMLVNRVHYGGLLIDRVSQTLAAIPRYVVNDHYEHG